MIQPFQKEIVFDITVNNEDMSKTRYELWLNTTISCKPYFSMLRSCDNDLSKRVVMYKETNLFNVIEKIVEIFGDKLLPCDIGHIVKMYEGMLLEYFNLYK